MLTTLHMINTAGGKVGNGELRSNAGFGPVGQPSDRPVPSYTQFSFPGSPAPTWNSTKLLMWRCGRLGLCVIGMSSMAQRRKPSTRAASGGSTSGEQQPTCARGR